jgi:hypothetical protein
VKIACVVQRYGLDVTGGAEAHCRAIAERLAGQHDVTVLTSCARDYLLWRNAYPAGESRVGPVRVLRFPVTRQRRLHRFADLTHQVYGRRSTREQQLAWFDENGPQTPALLEHLREHGSSYDLVLFWSYRYYPSFFGLPIVRDRAVLVPTAEEDPLVFLDVLSEYFTLPAGSRCGARTRAPATLLHRRVGPGTGGLAAPRVADAARGPRRHLPVCAVSRARRAQQGV